MTVRERRDADQPAPAPYPAELTHPADGADAACYVCGQRRTRRTSDDGWVCDLPLHPAGPRERPRRDVYGHVVADLKPDQPWRRRHVACEATDIGIVRGVLGVEVSESVARDAVEAAELTIARNVNETGRRPWDFVSGEQRATLRREVDAAIAALLPRPHVTGRCAVCGRSRSLRWFTSVAVAWPDGRGVLCEQCAEVERTVLDRYDEQARRHAHVCALAGLVRAIGHDNDYGLRYAAEVLDDAERHVDGSGPWAYRPASLSAVRQAARDAEPGSIVDDMQRAIALRIRQARRERERAQQAVEQDGAATVSW